MSGTDDTAFVDYYALLGVAPSAQIASIRRAYLQKAKEHHPDAGGTVEVMQQLNAAYRTLVDSSQKAAYDMLHSFHTGSAQTGDYRYSDGREVNTINDMTDEEIDTFLDSLLFDEYRDGVPKTSSGVSHWFKRYFKL